MAPLDFREPAQIGGGGIDDAGRGALDGEANARGIPGGDPDGAGRVSGSGGPGVTVETYPRGLYGLPGIAGDDVSALRSALQSLDRDLKRVEASLDEIDALLERYPDSSR